MSTNLGKAYVRATISAKLPGVSRYIQKHTFDISANNFELLANSSFFPPLLAECVKANDESFAAIYPSKRKVYVNNYVSGASGSPIADDGSSVIWKPIGSTDDQGFFSQLVKDEEFDSYILASPETYTDVDSDYIGPKWDNKLINGISAPNDESAIAAFGAWVKGDTSKASWGSTSTSDEKSLSYAGQMTVRDGLWWGAESSAFLTDNMHFWVNLRVAQSPPSKDHETCFIISFNDGDGSAIDIYMGLNTKPKVIDYSNKPFSVREFDVDLSKILDSQEEIEIGIMTIAGRLVVTVNQVTLIYTRCEKTSEESDSTEGTIKEVRIGAGSVKIFGTNVQAMINACPMSFAATAALAIPLPVHVNDADSGDTTGEWMGVNNHFELEGSVAELPQQPDKAGSLYGVDCAGFGGLGGGCSPYGMGFHNQGYIDFSPAPNTGVDELPSSSFYILTMTSSHTTVANGGAPFFFRLKGARIGEEEPDVGEGVPVSGIISASQTITAPDYHHVESSASLELYNKNGVYNGLTAKQGVLRMGFGWEGYAPTTFTGIIISSETRMVAGQETIALECKDTMQVLKDSPIVNSPFYDGMVALYAIKDLAQRAGINKVIADWDNEDDYFLPSGYVFTQPKMRYSSEQSIFDCIIDMVKRFEAFVYFDGSGNFHVDRLEGGLFGDSSREPVGAFTIDPSSKNAIIDSFNIGYDFSSTVNRISIMTVDRDTRNPIIITHSSDDSVLAYRKLMLLDQAALGGLEEAKEWAARLGERVFYPIRKTTFSTPGGESDVGPLDFFSVEGSEFRCMSKSTTCDAMNNDLRTEYVGEWLYGK